jgi:hypothetical protein
VSSIGEDELSPRVQQLLVLTMTLLDLDVADTINSCSMFNP